MTHCAPGDPMLNMASQMYRQIHQQYSLSHRLSPALRLQSCCLLHLIVGLFSSPSKSKLKLHLCLPLRRRKIRTQRQNCLIYPTVLPTENPRYGQQDLQAFDHMRKSPRLWEGDIRIHQAYPQPWRTPKQPSSGPYHIKSAAFGIEALDEKRVEETARRPTDTAEGR
jgi:hypothetical protein